MRTDQMHIALIDLIFIILQKTKTCSVFISYAKLLHWSQQERYWRQRHWRKQTLPSSF